MDRYAMIVSMTEQTAPQLALIGSTASGKSALALETAARFGAIILSLDSLSIYRQIDIASAKPSPAERGEIPHFGIDLIRPDEPFDVLQFVDLYREARRESVKRKAPLIIVGGSSFYLKILLEGISPLPPIDEEIRNKVNGLISDLPKAYTILRDIDPEYADTLAPSDRYRIEKALLISLSTGQGPSGYFRDHPPLPVIEEPLPMYEILTEREVLRKRIAQRTDRMLSEGLVDEVLFLESTYGRRPSPMKAIGIREVLDYLDGMYDYAQMREKIITHTARLAKRQRTFNQSQFNHVIRGDIEELRKKIAVPLDYRR